MAIIIKTDCDYICSIILRLKSDEYKTVSKSKYRQTKHNDFMLIFH